MGQAAQEFTQSKGQFLRMNKQKQTSGMDLDLIFSQANQSVLSIKTAASSQSSQTKEFNPPAERAKRYVYRFKIEGGAGTVVTPDSTIDKVRTELEGRGWNVLEISRASG